MVFGMATSKITITLHDDQIKEIRALVEAGQAASVSAFGQHAVGVALSDAAGWREMLKDALQQTGGGLTKKGAHLGRRGTLLCAGEEKPQERKGGMSGVTFDAGGLIAFDRKDRRPPRASAR